MRRRLAPGCDRSRHIGPALRQSAALAERPDCRRLSPAPRRWVRLSAGLRLPFPCRSRDRRREQHSRIAGTCRYRRRARRDGARVFVVAVPRATVPDRRFLGGREPAHILPAVDDRPVQSSEFIAQTGLQPGLCIRRPLHSLFDDLGFPHPRPYLAPFPQGAGRGGIAGLYKIVQSINRDAEPACARPRPATSPPRHIAFAGSSNP